LRISVLWVHSNILIIPLLDCTGYPPQTKPAVSFFNSLLDKTPGDAVETTTRWIKWLVYFRFIFRLAFLKCKSKENDDLKEKLQIIVQDVTEKEIDLTCRKRGENKTNYKNCKIAINQKL
jgi:hypothetical protein